MVSCGRDFDGTTVTTYLDGEMVTDGIFSFGSATDAPIQIGDTTDNGINPCNGAIDEVKIYDVVLTVEEIAELM